MALGRVCHAATVFAAGCAVVAGLARLNESGVEAAPVDVGPASAVIPFPSSPAGVGQGGLHTLPAFQCELRRDGPPGRCTPLVGDDGWGERSTTDEEENNSASACTVADDNDGCDADVFGRPPGLLEQLFDGLFRSHGPSIAFSSLSKTTSWAVPRRAAAATRNNLGIPYVGAVTRALTLRRNSLGGHILRVRGNAFVVLVFSHTTAGQCPEDSDGGCGLPTALATLGARKGAPMAALTVTKPASGSAVDADAAVAAATSTTAAAAADAVATPTVPATRLVTMSDTSLLSAGRAVLADGR
ncbi:hypothetical protein MMPV_003537 [Pyropia vietnamensis]